jgi:T5SS/PEP-CTERM-associated repeat protein
MPATIALFVASTVSTHAQTHWTGQFSSNWFLSGNWDAGFPRQTTDGNIDTVTPNSTVIADPGAFARNLTVGQSGTGMLTIQTGGTLADSFGTVGNLPGSQGTVTVTGAGSSWSNAGGVVVGGLGTGTLIIQDGGTVSGGGGSVGQSAGSTGTVMVTDPGSSWINGPSGGLNIGSFGTGTLMIANGGVVINITNFTANIGNGANSQGTVTVNGAGSVWSNSSGVNVGNSGTGTLTVADGGVVTGPIVIANNAGSIGILNIGAVAGNPAVSPGTLTTSSVAFGAGTGTLNFNHTSTNYTFAPTISGNGSVNVLAGITILTAMNTYAGATTINGGGLIVNGSIASSSLTTVSAGGTLGGNGIVGSTVINTGGFLVPGSVGTPGTMTVTGNLAFQSGALYVVQVNPTASSTNVSGSASLAGTVAATFAPGSSLTRSYIILTAAGGRSGTFDALATSGLPADFQASLSYPGNTAVLKLTAELVPEPTPPTSSTPPAAPPFNFTIDEINDGHAIDNFFNNGGTLPPAFVPLFGLTAINLAKALTQIDGEAATDAEKGAFKLMDQFLGLMLDPFADGRSGTGWPSGGGNAMSFAPEQAARFPPDVALAYAGVLKAPPKPAALDQRWSAWGGSFGGSNTTNGDPVIGSTDVTARDYGFGGGMDYHFNRDMVAGFALAGGGTNWGLAQGLGGGRSDAFQAGVYGATRSGPAYVSAALAFANHWMTTDRYAFGGDHLNASFDGQSYAGRLEAGYRYAVMPMIGVTPYAALQVQDFHTPGYSETDLTRGGFGLSYNSMNATDTRSELGTRFDDMTMIGTMPLSLRARAAWAHDWVSNPNLMPVFQALPGAAFIVNGATAPKNSALGSAGAELHLTANWSLAAKFDSEFASGSQTYAGTGTLRYTW